MKIRKLILTTAAGVLLTVFTGMTPASAAPQKQSGPTAPKQDVQKAKSKPLTGVSRGTISSIDADKLVLSQKAKDGKAEEKTYMLSPKTERKGDLTAGSQVSVHYRSENNQLMATAVQGPAQKTASNTKKPAAAPAKK